MPNTLNRAYPYPSGSDANDVPYRMQQLAEAVDADMVTVSAAAGDHPGWQAVTTLGVGYSNAAPWTAVRYRRRAGRVTVQGRVSGTGGVSNVLFTLPIGYRPSADAIDGDANDALVWAADANATTVRLAVWTDGRVTVLTSGTITSLSLAPIVFDVD